MTEGIENEIKAQKIPIKFIIKAINLATLEIQCQTIIERDKCCHSCYSGQDTGSLVIKCVIEAIFNQVSWVGRVSKSSFKENRRNV
jgi:hypothetical protein